MLRLIAVMLMMLVSLCAAAQDARRYAVLSLVGDKLTIVQREMSTGSHLDRNERTVVELADNTIDRAIVLAIDDTLRRAIPGSQPILLASQRANVYEASYQSPGRKDGVARVFEVVKPIVAGTPATHLLLVTRHRHRAMLRLRDGHVGSGFLEGVGFYVDHGSMARGYDTNDAEAGFIAPYTYMKLSLIDLATGKVVAEEPIIGSSAAAPNPWERNVGNAWHRLSDADKVARLTEVIRSEASRAVPAIVARR